MKNEKPIADMHQQNNLTIEQVRSLPGFDHLSDDQVSELIEDIKELALLLNRIPSVDRVSTKK